MIDRFSRFVKEKKLFEPHQKILLAISGGIDSMVLLHLFEKSGFKYGLVHCNFQLREEESEEDERFVKEQVSKHGIPAFFERFETEEHAKIYGISIEMAARELRYNYFEQIRAEHNYDFTATAHHQDDLIETFFLNLTRKTGIKGLTGIKEKVGKIIRPLMFASRDEIMEYAQENDIEYREDSSNNELVFQRNYLRHKILPLFSELSPAFKKNMIASIENLKEVEQVYDWFISQQVSDVITQEENGIVIDIEALKQSKFPALVLLENLKPYDFNPTVVDEIYNSLDSDSGKQFYSNTHRLIKDRDKLYVTPIANEKDRIFYIEEDDLELFAPNDIKIERLSSENFEIVSDQNVACLDLNKLEFPLLIRKWKQGDYFQPLGMTGFKKVSDFFIDQKIPLHKKENIWLLCSGKNIVWIMGQRIDNRFKITSQTKEILKIEMNSER